MIFGFGVSKADLIGGGGFGFRLRLKEFEP
jgi:hypothetical protein